MRKNSIKEIERHNNNRGYQSMNKKTGCAEPDPISILETANIGIIQLDRNYCIIYANSPAAGLLQKDREDVLGESLQDMVPESMYGKFSEALDRSLNENVPASFEVFYPQPVDLWLQIRAKTSREGLTLVIQDITDQKRAEKALIAAKDDAERNFLELQTIIENMGEGVIVADVLGHILLINRAMLAIAGLESVPKEHLDQYVGRVELKDADGRDVTPEQWPIARALRGETVRDVEFCVRRLDTGKCYTAQYNAAPVLDKDGRILLAIGTARDITRRKRAEEELQQAEEKIRGLNVELEQKVQERTRNLEHTARRLEEQKELLQTIIDHIPVMITLLDPAGKIRLVNREFEELLERTLEEARGMDFISAVNPVSKEREEIWNYIQEAKNGWQDFEVSARSGKVLISSWANVHLSDGTLIGIGVDVSGRKKMEQDLLRLAAATEQAGEGIALFSPEGVYEYFNPAYERLYGYGREELIGKTTKFIGEDVHEMHQNIWRKIRADKEMWTGRITRRKKNGAILEVYMTVAPVYDSAGKIMDYVSVSRDVTDEVRSQQHMLQSQKLEAIGALAGGVAHDLKNILTPILLNTEFALEDVGEDHPVYPALEEVLHAAHLGKDLVSQILTFSRRTPQKKVPVNISSLIRETTTFLKSSLPSGIEVREKLEDECAMAQADPTQIKQVLINLGTNAGYAMKQQGGILEIDLVCRDLDEEEIRQIFPEPAPEGYLRITVQDTGVGMDEQTMDHIFEPFFTTKPKDEGTGMGLAVTHGIIKEHRGDITVQSSPGKGSVFTVYLPKLRKENPDNAR